MTQLERTGKGTAKGKRGAVGQLQSSRQTRLLATRTPTPLLLPNARDGEVHSVSFHYFDLTAREVAIAGSFNYWQPQPLHKRGEDWFLELILPPGKYEYRFLIDGEWKDDPLAAAYVKNPYGTLNSVLMVGALRQAESVI
jgi:1,4-alpha-glucan branching enzyme